MVHYNYEDKEDLEKILLKIHDILIKINESINILNKTRRQNNEHEPKMRSRISERCSQSK